MLCRSRSLVDRQRFADDLCDGIVLSVHRLERQPGVDRELAFGYTERDASESAAMDEDGACQPQRSPSRSFDLGACARRPRMRRGEARVTAADAVSTVLTPTEV